MNAPAAASDPDSRQARTPSDPPLLRAGVVGAGVFGGYHAQKYAELPGVALAGVYDPHADRAAGVCARFGGRAFDSLDALIADCDLISIASPATTHAEAALKALTAGLPLYVEKPLAVDMGEAQALVDLAARKGVVLACGFIERLLLEAAGLLGAAPPVRFSAVRAMPAAGRNLDVSVVLDLMIHDIDALLALGAGPALAVEAEGRGLGDHGYAEVSCEIVFESGATANLTASRDASSPERHWTMGWADGRQAHFDLIGMQLRDGGEASIVRDLSGLPMVQDRLRESLRRFVGAVRGEEKALACGQSGLEALDLALAVEAALGI
jgi:predicted dehydrogenase